MDGKLSSSLSDNSMENFVLETFFRGN